MESTGRSLVIHIDALARKNWQIEHYSPGLPKISHSKFSHKRGVCYIAVHTMLVETLVDFTLASKTKSILLYDMHIDSLLSILEIHVVYNTLR